MQRKGKMPKCQNAKMPKCKLHPSLYTSSRPVKRRVYNRRDPAPGYPHSNHHHILPHHRSPSLMHPKPQQEAAKQEISATTTKNNIHLQSRDRMHLRQIEKSKEEISTRLIEAHNEVEEQKGCCGKKDVRGNTGYGRIEREVEVGKPHKRRMERGMGYLELGC